MKLKFLVLAAALLFSRQLAAQTPATVHATWSPNPTTDNVVQYTVSVDAGTPIIVLASSCSATQCPTAPLLLTVGAFGAHTVTIAAQNLKLSTDPTSFQSGPALSVSFTLGAVPSVVVAGKITN